ARPKRFQQCLFQLREPGVEIRYPGVPGRGGFGADPLHPLDAVDDVGAVDFVRCGLEINGEQKNDDACDDNCGGSGRALHWRASPDDAMGSSITTTVDQFALSIRRTLPWWARTISRQMASPRPLPGRLRLCRPLPR